MLPNPAQRIAFEEYVQAVDESTERVQPADPAPSSGSSSTGAGSRWWRALQACRGIQLIHGVRIVAELGDLSRFTHPRQLMAYLGLIPSEDSSGERRHQGAITKAGNSSARRALVEAAHAYHYRAGDPGDRPAPSRCAQGGPDIAWKAQLRLCARFRRLAAAA